jgi:hypothetical protein
MHRLFSLSLTALGVSLVAACGSSAAAPGGGASGGVGGSGAAGGAGAGGEGGAGAQGGSAGAGGSEGGAGGQGGAPPVAAVHRVGRFELGDPSRPVASWSGTGVHTRLSGARLDVTLDGAPGIFFEVSVDGVPTSVLETTGGEVTYTVVDGLVGEHDVSIVRQNEGFFGDVTWVAVTPGPGDALVETPSPFAHRLELVGDSITCGYGVLGPDATCSFSAETESVSATYGAIAARNVGAEARFIAYSGKGVFQNYGGDQVELMPELWLRTLTNDPGAWDFTAWQPEAVVVNLGTNDLSAPIAEAEFVGAYVDLLDAVRLRYPAALVFTVTWQHWGEPKAGWVADAMAMTGDPALRLLTFTIDPEDGFGCDYHPSLATHAKLGALLTQALEAELGW